MLDSATLAEYISEGIRGIVCPAIKECLLRSYPAESEAGNAIAENFANNFDELVSEHLGICIAAAIDYYIKNAEIHGFLMSSGPPALHTINVSGLSVPSLNGVVPNTLGIR